MIQSVVMVGDATDDDGSDGPEHLKHLSSGSSQLHGHNLGTVCGGVGDEDSPRNTLEDLRHQHHRERVGEVEDKDEGVQGHEAGDGRPAVSDFAGEGTSEEDAEQRTDGTDSLERRLPLGLDDPFTIIVDTVIFGESREGDETADEEDAVRLHDLEVVLAQVRVDGECVAHNSAGHDKGPERSHGVRSNGLEHTHVVLRILCLDSILLLGICRLVLGSVRLVFNIVGMLDLLAALGLYIDGVAHVGWCLPE